MAIRFMHGLEYDTVTTLDATEARAIDCWDTALVDGTMGRLSSERNWHLSLRFDDRLELIYSFRSRARRDAVYHAVLEVNGGEARVRAVR